MTRQFKLIIKAASHTVPDQTIDCDAQQTVLQLKQTIEQIYPNKPSPENMRLIYSGFLMRDEDTLKSIFQPQPSEPIEADSFIIHLVCNPKQTGQSKAPANSVSRNSSIVSSTPTTSSTETPPQVQFASFTNTTSTTTTTTTSSSSSFSSSSATASVDNNASNQMQLDQISQLYNQMQTAYVQYLNAYLQTWQALAISNVTPEALLQNQLWLTSNPVNIPNLVTPPQSAPVNNVHVPPAADQMQPNEAEAAQNVNANDPFEPNNNVVVRQIDRAINMIFLLLFAINFFSWERWLWFVLIVIMFKAIGRMFLRNGQVPENVEVPDNHPEPPVQAPEANPNQPANETYPNTTPNPPQTPVTTSRLQFLWHVLRSLVASFVPDFRQVHFF